MFKTLTGFGMAKKKEKRFRKSLGRLEKVNSHLVQMMNFDKENYFLNLKKDTQKSRLTSNQKYTKFKMNCQNWEKSLMIFLLKTLRRSKLKFIKWTEKKF